MNNEIMFYTNLCEQYGIDEEAMELYAYNDMILNEENYNEYVKKCKRTGKEPMTQEEYLARKSRIKKGLAAGAAIAATAGAAYGAHKYAKNKGYKGTMDMVGKKKAAYDTNKAKAMAKGKKAGELEAKREARAAKREARNRHGLFGWFKNKDDREIDKMLSTAHKNKIQNQIDAENQAYEWSKADAERKRKYAIEDEENARKGNSLAKQIQYNKDKAQALQDRINQYAQGKSKVKDIEIKDKNGNKKMVSEYDLAIERAQKDHDDIYNLKETYDLYDLFTDVYDESYDDYYDDYYDEDYSFDLYDLFI